MRGEKSDERVIRSDECDVESSALLGEHTVYIVSILYAQIVMIVVRTVHAV